MNVNINMGLGESDEKSRFSPSKGVSHSHKDFYIAPGNTYNVAKEVEKAKDEVEM